ncbi:hypothetical protein [Streptosporangium canum]|uniref:hypothetical protein n=1 Tax=Streptosporangium canum TaxID=324952 RepID=UPI0037B9B249
MAAMTPSRTEPDLSFPLDHAVHVLRTGMSAALPEGERETLLRAMNRLGTGDLAAPAEATAAATA